jgi:AraC-like DNA-binding protein
MSKYIKYMRETVIVPTGTDERLVPERSPDCLPIRRAHIQLSGLYDVVAGYSVERSAPGFHEAIYTLRGTGRCATSKGVVTVRSGELLILPGSLDYRYGPQDGDWRFMWFHLEDRGSWRNLAEEGLRRRRSYVINELQSAMEGVLAETIRAEAGSRRLTTLFAEQVVIYLEREFASTDTARDRVLRQQLQDLWDHVNARLDQEWDVQGLAERMNMSTSHFRRTVVRLAGCSPIQMVFHLRMRRAEELLGYYGESLAVIAELVGYSTPFAFSNAFSRYKGMSPKKYRAQLKVV